MAAKILLYLIVMHFPELYTGFKTLFKNLKGGYCFRMQSIDIKEIYYLLTYNGFLFTY